MIHYLIEYQGDLLPVVFSSLQNAVDCVNSTCVIATDDFTVVEVELDSTEGASDTQRTIREDGTVWNKVWN